ncbi:facilitated trehalose transporter Tret1-like [Scylla paramamosain]|uniref:facilitated trehalose transporter Tret1-like n=1 Tax=Scylla paramamosain TaxID=85552 RepID=UPI0030838066
MGTEAEVNMSVNIDVVDPRQENPVHEFYCNGIQSPVYIYNHIESDKTSPTTKPHQYEAAGVHLGDDAGRRASHQETRLKTCCCGRSTPHFEWATFRLTMATLVMALIQIQAGTAFCFSGVTLPQMTDAATEDLFLDPHQAALFGSLVNLGAVAGTCLSWPLLVRLGQRKTLLVGLPFSLLAWFTLAFSPTTWLLQMARFILGLTMSMLTPAANLYLLEISHRKIRGRLLGTMTLSRNLGGLVVTLIGSLPLSWRQVGLLCSIFSVLPILGVFFLPNSPRWLITQNRMDEAHSALVFFRKTTYDPLPELHDITEQAEIKTCSGGSVWRQMKMLFQSETRHTFCVLSLIAVFVAFCGSCPLMTYLVPILQVTNDAVDPYLSAVFCSFTRIFGIIIHIGVVDKLGRKPLIIASFFLCSVCTAAYGFYFHLNGNTNPDINWVPLMLILFFTLFSGVGLPVITVLQGELLPTNCRAAGLSLLTCLLMLGGFTSSHTYYMTVAALGHEGAFWLFSISSILLVIVAILGLQETRGRTLEDISTPRLKAKHSMRLSGTQFKAKQSDHMHKISMNSCSVWSVTLPGTKKPRVI